MDDDKRADRILEQARIAHDSHRKGMSDTFSAITSFANAAMRTPGIAAAGGIAGMLGFFAANSAAIKGTAAAAAFNAGMLWFFGSIFLCVLAPGMAWFSQGFFYRALGAHEFANQHPYTRKTVLSNRWFIAGRCAQVATVVVVFLSIGCLFLGAYKFLSMAALVAR